MIVRDDSERGISPLTAPQPSTAQADAPVSRGRMVQIPGWIIPLYAGLFIALGWFGASSGAIRHRRKRCLCRWLMRRFCR
ncbi:pullulanase-specific type II secretion system component B [Klebsiella variicola]|nr:pullulanase-specific type II secretion system component B [Klebsiella variicola]